MDLFSLSINHHTAPLEVREKIWFSEEEARSSVHRLKGKFFRECMLFSTCNRTELYAANPRGHAGAADLSGFLIEMKGAGGSVSPDHFVAKDSEEVLTHLFRVAGGIDSMVIGDIQILNQVKEGFRFAREERTLGPVLNRLMQHSLRVGKRARAETSISEGAVSVSYAAVELANKIFDDLSTKSVLLVGAGKTGELTLRHLISKGISRIKVANRTADRAQEIVSTHGGIVVPFGQIDAALSEADIAITSVTAAGPVINAAMVARAMKIRKRDPLFLIDLGVPRNIDPEARRVDNVFLYDLDSLGTVVNRNLGKRADEIPSVEAIVKEEVKHFVSWYSSLQVGPTIQELLTAVESIRSGEVQKNINRFNAEDRELVDLVTKRIVKKILHQPIMTLKQQSENGSVRGEVLEHIHALREIFGLGRQDYDE
ncbi:MAG: glutamyl-tRNA reductase [Ignavibacteria bacterium]|nr:glutamyl-tRNA reductase [Ignavibacteria bacterium]